MPDTFDEVEAARTTADRRRRYLLGAIGWDGGLPMAVALTPELFQRLRIHLDLTALVAGFGVLTVAAVIRASRAQGQIERGGHIRGIWWRQCLLDVAILVLMIFEVGLNLAILNRGMRADEVEFAVFWYVTYLVLILIALWPARMRA